MSYPLKKLWKILEVQNWYAFDSKCFNEIEWFPLIRIRNIKNSTTDTKYTWEIKENYIVNNWDFLIWMDWEFKCYKWEWWPALLNQRVCRLVFQDSNIEWKYIFYWINKYLKDIEDITPFVTVKHISSKQIKDIDFPLPPLPTQKAIVQKLDIAFEKIDVSIELAQKNLENVEELGKSVLEEVFWESEYKTNKLKEIITLIMWQSPKSETYNRQGKWLPFFQWKKEFWEKFPTPEVYCSIPIRVAQKWDILMSVRAPVWPTNIANSECCIWRWLCAIRANMKIIEQDYLLHYLKKIEIEIASLWKWSTFSSITKSDLENLKIPLPPLEKQKEIVEHLDRVFEGNKRLKESYEEKIASLREMKQSLLREAFEGRLVRE